MRIAVAGGIDQEPQQNGDDRPRGQVEGNDPEGAEVES